MKLRGALLLLVAGTICTLSGLISPQVAGASVDFVNQWPVKPNIVSDSAAGTVTGKFTPGAGTNRLMLVSVATDFGVTATNPTITVNYGGQAVTATAVNATANTNKIWLGYLNEAGIAAGAAGNKTLTVTSTGTLTAMYVSVAVFNGVDQTTPISGSGSAVSASTAASLPVSAAYNVTGWAGNNGLSVYVVNWGGGTSTAGGGHTELRDYAGTNMSIATGYAVITTGTATPATTPSGTFAGAIAAVGLTPVSKANSGTNYQTIVTCGDCHATPPVDGSARNVPPGGFQGSHEKHTSDGDVGYSQACTVCHRNNTTTTHSNGRIHVSGTGITNTTYSLTSSINTNSRGGASVTLGTCSTVTCHSTGRAAGMGTVQYTNPTWGGSVTCLSCHAGRASALGAPANSTAGFKLSTTHSQHLKYPAANINCNICHSKTAANAASLKQYTGIAHHVNNTRDVTFTGVAYGSYTSYKSLESGSAGTNKYCGNVSCHGGMTRSAWSYNTVNTTNTCTHCHGQPMAANIPANNSNRKMYAPGWVNGSYTGTSTDQITVSTNARVGAHFVHLSSVYMAQIKCNECHYVPADPFDISNNHMSGPRYNSQTLYFGQSSSAKILKGVAKGSKPAQLAAFAGYTVGTSSTAATCSSVYCHGNRLKNSVTSGTARKPTWNKDYTATPATATSCGTCHGFPPTDGGLHQVTDTTCSTCHSHVASGVNPTTFVNKALHINGIVEVSGGHAYPYPGGSPQHKTDAGTTWSACSGCHTTSGTGTMTDYATWVAGGHVTHTAPACSVCHIGGLANSSCSQCHGLAANNGTATAGEPGVAGSNVFPNISGSHTVHMTKVASISCSSTNSCHSGFGTGAVKHGFANTTTTRQVNVVGTNTTNDRLGFAGTFSAVTWTPATKSCNNTCHGSGAVWGGRLKCVDCHNSSTLVRTKAGGYTMANVVAEFQISAGWGHTRTQGFTVTDEDCIVCHLEGSMATLSKTAMHGDGNIDLRDHNTATNDVAITDLGGAAITFKRFTTTFAAGSRSSTLVNTSVRDVVTRKFCLGCHKAGGSSNTTAGQGGIAPGGTALKPFGSTGGTVINTNAEFATTNSSRHPVLGPLNKDYPTQARLNAPYNGFTRTGGTKANGVIINCFDCHNVQTGPLLTHRTVSAHGNAVTIRGTVNVSQPTLCTLCHSGYTGSSAGHGSGSAFQTVDSHMDSSQLDLCYNCHASSASATRPTRATDAHGNNVIPTGSVTKAKRWAIAGAVPISFIRNNNWLANHQPKNIGGTTTWGGAAGSQCDMTGCGSRTGCPYTPGGTY